MQNRLWQDAKSALQEKSQEEQGVTPHYEVIKETGPDHDKQFIVGVYIQDALIAEGKAKANKKPSSQRPCRARKKGW